MNSLLDVPVSQDIVFDYLTFSESCKKLKAVLFGFYIFSINRILEGGLLDFVKLKTFKTTFYSQTKTVVFLLQLRQNRTLLRRV